jgi:CheY-like chemotaxis protein
MRASLSSVVIDARPLVLLIEDFDDAREMYAEYLEYTGFRTVGSPDALKGLQLARELQPHVILMDACLPGLNGWDATKRLKSDPATRHIPVVMVTGHVQGDARARAFEAGADSFMAKPCLPDELARHIVEALRKCHPTDV